MGTTFADWRASVERELEGKSFEKALVSEAFAGFSVQPLYASAPRVPRDASVEQVRFVMRHGPEARVGELVADLTDGADGVWVSARSLRDEVLKRPELQSAFFIVDVDEAEASGALASRLSGRSYALTVDPIGDAARGIASVDAIETRVKALPALAKRHRVTSVMVSTLPYHHAGAEADDELACVLSAGVHTLQALIDGGLTPDEAASSVALQVAVGRDTFVELCKLRALRLCWSKVLVAFLVKQAPRTLIHAVCSSRTLTTRDPWVNMLRVTTQVFAAMLGGAQVVTANSFDQALGSPSALGHRLARNTGLVLRDESHLGRVADAAGGSYAFESITDSLARRAFAAFQALEKDGGVVAALKNGALVARFDASWAKRLEGIAKRKTSILGVSEFANLNESKLAGAATATASVAPGSLPVRRDSAAFEALRDIAEAKREVPEAILLTLGDYASSRARAGFASSFLTAGGIRTRETASVEKASIACLCGTDERYAAEALDQVKALKAAGCQQVVVAGRPGALEPALREAGVDAFIFVGCDAVATLVAILGFDTPFDGAQDRLTLTGQERA